MDLARLLTLRTLTNALSEYFANRARDYLANLSQLLQPRVLLGDLVRYEKCAVKGQDVAFQELLKRFHSVAKSSALNVQPELKPPLDCYGGPLELYPATYSYLPEGGTKPITIVSPLRWVLGYKDMGPQRLRELIVIHDRSGGNELQSCALHYVALQLLTERRPGPVPLMEALRFPVSSAPQPELGGIPFVFVSALLPSVRPPDLLILQTTQISGTATFEEVVDAERIAELKDPIREEVLSLMSEHAADLKDELGL